MILLSKFMEFTTHEKPYLNFELCVNRHATLVGGLDTEEGITTQQLASVFSKHSLKTPR